MTIPAGLPPEVRIREVGPRDGLQPEEPLPVGDRVRLIELLLAAGVRHVEVAAFVSPKAVPAMAGAAEVLAAVPASAGVVRAALVPNLQGAVAALDAGADELTVTISASETYNQRNVRRSIAQSIEEIAAIAAATQVVPVDAVVSCAFGSPYEGEMAPVRVAELTARVLDAGADALTMADTTGMATPRRVHELLDALAGIGLQPREVGMHLHDTRGTALLNAYAALERGVERFDTAFGGLGGSPFAHGAGGNLATEGLVALLDDLGVRTGIAVASLLEATERLGELIGRSLPSPVAHHGPRLALPGGSGHSDAAISR